MRPSSRLAVFSLLLLAGIGVRAAQSKLAVDYRDLGADDAVYALPRPEDLVLLSLGHREALADWLFGRTLVDAGIHFAEHRTFEPLDKYLNAIIFLDPRYRDVYYYADSLLTLSTVIPPPRNYRAARDIEEKGLPLFPADVALWMTAGQYVAYLAPQHTPPEESKDEWRAAGAKMIGHACGLGDPFYASSPACIGATGLLSKAGELEASRHALERLIELSDDREVKAEAEARLTRLLGLELAEKATRRRERAKWLRERDLPFVPRPLYTVLGPGSAVEKCAGLIEPSSSSACATGFASWEELVDQGK